MLGSDPNKASEPVSIELGENAMTLVGEMRWIAIA